MDPPIHPAWLDIGSSRLERVPTAALTTWTPSTPVHARLRPSPTDFGSWNGPVSNRRTKTQGPSQRPSAGDSRAGAHLTRLRHIAESSARAGLHPLRAGGLGRSSTGTSIAITSSHHAPVC